MPPRWADRRGKGWIGEGPRDSESFNRLHAEQLLYLPGVRQVRSFMVLRNVLSTTELPLAV